MPELPEVEVLRRSLAPHVTGDVIRGVRVWDKRLRETVDSRGLGRRLRHRRIERLDRRAKYLLVHLQGGQTLAVHLGMSGRLTLVDAEEPRQDHEHVGLFLESNRRLRFRDPRRFGLVFALPTADVGSDRHFAHLGPEPLDRLDGAVLASAAKGRRGPVKNFLMDARVVVGVGNIYACEALYRARVHPGRSVARIGRERWDRLAAAVRQTLEQAIGEGGTTLNDFTDGEGNDGYFQVSLAVYGRQGKACPRCGRAIARRVQAGRSTFYCPGCQR